MIRPALFLPLLFSCCLLGCEGDPRLPDGSDDGTEGATLPGDTFIEGEATGGTAGSQTGTATGGAAGSGGSAGSAGSTAGESGAGGASGSDGEGGAAGGDDKPNAMCDMQCDRGSHCELVQVQCFAPPCDALPTCVADSSDCDVVDCAEGSHCEARDGVAKCVRDGGGGQGDGDGVKCGDTMCETGMECCNPSCGTCTPPGGLCTQQICG